MRTAPRLSVIVPFHDVEEHFTECLASLRAQTLTDVEYILVDDGSTDGGPAIAAAFAAADPRFTVVRGPNRGPGPAREAGIARASGDYLAFADGDDMVPPDAYRLMVETLDATGSDLACGAVTRIRRDGTVKARSVVPGFGATVSRTHVRAHRELIQDRHVVNKVFRRSFWDAHGFTFPEGPYEDAPVAIPAHVLSSATDVLADPVYLWRARPGSARDRRGDPERVARSLASAATVSAFLAEHARKLRRRHDQHIAETECPLLVEMLATARAGIARRLFDSARASLDAFHPAAAAGLPAIQRLQIHLVRTGMVKELAAVQRFARTEIDDHGLVRRGSTWYFDYPLLGDPRVPDETYEAGPELRAHAVVDDVRPAGDRLRVTGHAYLRLVDSKLCDIEVWLESGDWRIPLKARGAERPDVTADSRQSAVSHDRSGFVADVDPAQVPEGTWTLRARVSTRGVERAERARGHRDAGERSFRIGDLHVSLTPQEGLVLTADMPERQVTGRDGAEASAPADGESAAPLITGVRWTEAHELVLSGEGGSRTDRVVLRLGDSGDSADSDERHEWPVEWSGSRFSATVGVTADGLPPRSGRWRVLLGDRPLTLAAELVAAPPEPHTTAVHRISVLPGPGGELRLLVRPALRPDERGRYALCRLRGARRHHRSRIREAVLFDSYGGGQYSCNPRAVCEELLRRDLDLDLVWATRDGQFTVPDGVRTVLYGSREHEEALGTARFVVANRRTQPSWYEKRPDQTFVQTWHGTPLKRLGHDVKGKPLASRDIYEALDRYAAMWDLLLSPNPFSTPILRGAFGYDGEVLESGYPRNDVLLRPGHAERVRRALGVPDGTRIVLYAPTWRDDEHARRGRIGLALDAERVARALGEDTVLLVRAHYLMAGRVATPPPLSYAGGASDVGVVGGTARGRGIVEAGSAALGGRAFDVSRFPDMADLLAVTDVLVTDYSSAMFDFACTGRPMVFFGYDLERYRDQVRGFYFDFEKEAPGPIVRSWDGVVDAVRAALGADAPQAGGDRAQLGAHGTRPAHGEPGAHGTRPSVHGEAGGGRGAQPSAHGIPGGGHGRHRVDPVESPDGGRHRRREEPWLPPPYGDENRHQDENPHRGENVYRGENPHRGENVYRGENPPGNESPYGRENPYTDQNLCGNQYGDRDLYGDRHGRAPAGYRDFAVRFCPYDDGQASQRVVDRMLLEPR
ncbi:CDP-glycerol glycerophosphotransferase family protein [Microtetraspora fusca]|uniref:CDP-glycerol glycerophosphotransferase family protein n=1 Tax=Microtetraspora fusca TaxID=1997 RepID=UPI0014715DAD|nr:CDP-glycerol glycerophosphotransferase family protein [Microtetraspora fusca]